MVMHSGTAIWIFIAFCLVSNFKNCYSHEYDRAKIVTYGDPCIVSRQLPIKIEGPKPPAKEEKIPISLDFRIVSDMYVKPHRVEYPIAIDVPQTTPSPSEKSIANYTSEKTSYVYNTYVPQTANIQVPPKNYNFAVQVPVQIKHVDPERHEGIFYQRLRGLASHVDRILVPACEVSPSYKC
ncbi:uncharacterized protein LOC143341365 [Colletes latitarsis]|uniref:uncharacterized protein LOC143341365 n=1 Tax=Colletes latitarsis TaxID=2605962 RepID=UPI004035F77B